MSVRSTKVQRKIKPVKRHQIYIHYFKLSEDRDTVEFPFGECFQGEECENEEEE